MGTSVYAQVTMMMACIFLVFDITIKKKVTTSIMQFNPTNGNGRVNDGDNHLTNKKNHFAQNT